jgi:DNA-directed RNA polymerase subunit M/transcription elongation factor TFIIS
MNGQLCPNCAIGMKLIRDVNKVTFSTNYMNATFRCPKCGYEEVLPVAEYHVTSSAGFLCPKCDTSKPHLGQPQELARRAKGTTIEIDNKCKTCGFQWTTRVEWYRPKIPGLRF